MADFELVWRRIVALQGEPFETVKGKPFTYSVEGNGNVVRVTRTRQKLYKSGFKAGNDYIDTVSGPGELSRRIRGSAYIYAILRDRRVASR